MHHLLHFKKLLYIFVYRFYFPDNLLQGKQKANIALSGSDRSDSEFKGKRLIKKPERYIQQKDTDNTAQESDNSAENSGYEMPLFDSYQSTLTG